MFIHYDIVQPNVIRENLIRINSRNQFQNMLKYKWKNNFPNFWIEIFVEGKFWKVSFLFVELFERLYNLSKSYYQ